MEKEVAFGW